MFKSFIDSSNDFKNLNGKYHTDIYVTDDKGKTISFEASGETPEELYNDLLQNSIEAIINSKNSEKNDLDNSISDDKEEYVDVDEFLLQYAIELEDENDMLLDEVKFLRKLLKQNKNQFNEQINSMEKELNKLEEENENLYKVIFALQNEKMKNITPNRYKSTTPNDWPYGYKVWM